jgi:hypothetical protein
MKANTYDHTNEAGRVSNAGRSCLIRPSDLDFICEVDIAARRVLTSAELEYFCTFYKSAAVVVLPIYELADDGTDPCFDEHIASLYEEQRAEVSVMDTEMRWKLGTRFIETGIFGFSDYSSPIDVSGRTRRDGTRPRRSLSKSSAPKPITPEQQANRKVKFDKEKWVHGGIRTCSFENCTLCKPITLSERKFQEVSEK